MAIRHILTTAIEDDPTLTLRAYQQLLRDFGVFISMSTIDRWWRSQNITLKKINTIAREANDYECSIFWDLFETLCTDLKQLIWGDESHRDNKTVNKKYGRAPKYVIHSFLWHINRNIL